MFKDAVVIRLTDLLLVARYREYTSLDLILFTVNIADNAGSCNKTQGIFNR
jgi:hypothetical protein